MYISLDRCEWHFALVYLDDIFVFLEAREKEIYHVKQELTLLQRTKVTLKLNKCFFLANAINYLGHIIWPISIEITAQIADAIQKQEQLRNITKLRFLHSSTTSSDALSQILLASRHLSIVDFQIISLRCSVLSIKKSSQHWQLFEKTYFSSHASVAIRWKTFYAGNRRMKCAGWLRSITRLARLNDTTGWLLLTLSTKAGKLTISFSESSSISSCLYFFYVRTSNVHGLPSGLTTIPLGNSWTNQKQLEDSHDRDSVYLRSTLTSCISPVSRTNHRTHHFGFPHTVLTIHQKKTKFQFW